MKFRHLITAALYSLVAACGEEALPVSTQPQDRDGTETIVPQETARLHDQCLVSAEWPSVILDQSGARVNEPVECVMGLATKHVSFVKPSMPGTYEKVEAEPPSLYKQYKYVRFDNPNDPTKSFAMWYSNKYEREFASDEVQMPGSYYPGFWYRLPVSAKYVRINGSGIDKPVFAFAELTSTTVDLNKYGAGNGHYFVGWGKEGQPCAGGGFDLVTGDIPYSCGL